MAKHHPDLIFCRKQAGVGERPLATVRDRYRPLGAPRPVPRAPHGRGSRGPRVRGAPPYPPRGA